MPRRAEGQEGQKDKKSGRPKRAEGQKDKKSGRPKRAEGDGARKGESKMWNGVKHRSKG